ncbi:Uncharacterised protein (plasmid) [Tsukamurella tyrosinosolvens]|uniref:Uncharacterized protein n=1 Tax=Tsukamurella tyrosinosolvens TaxID=57704 RepID=A0A1H4VP47_TSUTY|nr:hypothetical protein SAMN04489793_3287 [Tsukamurella tyrosinosolvens]VEH90399.1 Uncharacterised protein [Tsukamurella tyrosinosolvens]
MNACKGGCGRIIMTCWGRYCWTCTLDRVRQEAEK